LVLLASITLDAKDANVYTSWGVAAEEMARAVELVASGDSSAMTGHNMIVSCGSHLFHPQELHML
jgi:hypothetical protein